MKNILTAATFLASVAASIGGPAYAATIHDYEFSNGLADSAPGGVSLASSNRGTATSSVSGGLYTFEQGAGLLLDSQLPGSTYTIDILANFSNVGGYNKLISFNTLGSDTGLYIYNGGLSLFNVAGSPQGGVVTPGSAFNVRLSRDGATGIMTGYLNNVQQFSYTDTTNAFLASSSLYFFRDDQVQNGEDSAGFADFVRISNDANGAPPIPVTPSVPEPATWAMMLLGFGAVGGAARYRRRNAAVVFA